MRKILIGHGGKHLTARGLLLVSILGCTALIAQAATLPDTASQATTPAPTDSSLIFKQQIGQVVITGSRTPRALKEVPALTRVITKHEIDIINPRAIDELLLTTIPGIEFYEHGGQKRMTIQGLGADYFLFLVDGERLCMEGSDAVDFMRINMANIARIEYIVGSGSALYGSNSIGGIINIITRKHSQPVEALYHGSYYTYSQQQHALHVGLKGYGLTSSTDGAYAQLNDYSIQNGTDSEGHPLTAIVPGMHSWNISQRLSWRSPSKRWRIAATGGYNDRLQNQGSNLKDRYTSYQAGLNGHYRFAQDHSLEANYHLDAYARKEIYSKDGNSQLFPIFNHRMHSGRLQYNWEPLRARWPKVNAGYEILFEQLSSDRLPQNQPAQHTLSNTLYAQCDWQPLDWLALSAGIRLDIHSRYGAHASPRLALLFKYKGLQLRTAYTQGFRSPNLKELYQDWNHQGMFFIVGNTKLKPEVSHMFIFAPEFSNHYLDVCLSGNFSIIDHRIFLTPAEDAAGRQLMLYTNIQKKSRMLVLSASLRLKLGQGFTESLNYSYLNDLEFTQNDKGQTVKLTNTRPHNFSATTAFAHQFNDYRLSMELSGRYLSAVDMGVINYATKELTMVHYDGYALFKLGLSHWWKNFVGLSLGIDNLFDYRADRVSIANSLSPGRNYFVALTLRY